MKLRKAIGGGTVGGLGVGVILGYATAAVCVIAMPFVGAYYGATMLGAYAATQWGAGFAGAVLGGVGGFIGGGTVASAVAPVAFYSVLGVTTLIGSIGGVIVGGVGKVLGVAGSAAPKSKPAKSVAVQVPANQNQVSGLASKAAKPGFDKAKSDAPVAQQTKKPAPKPKAAPKR